MLRLWYARYVSSDPVEKGGKVSVLMGVGILRTEYRLQHYNVDALY